MSASDDDVRAVRTYYAHLLTEALMAGASVADVLKLLVALAEDERRAVWHAADTDQEERDRGRETDVWLLSDELTKQFVQANWALGRALDVETLDSYLASVTPQSPAAVEQWRAAMEQWLLEAPHLLAQTDAAAAQQNRDTEQYFDAKAAYVLDGQEGDWERGLRAQRAPLAQAIAALDQQQTALRGYLRARLYWPMVGHAAPGKIVRVQADRKLCDVQLTIEGTLLRDVDYGSGSVQPGDDTVAYLPVRLMQDPRRHDYGLEPYGRAWIVAPPPRGKRVYWEWAGQLYKTPWPLTNPDAEPEHVRDLLGTTGVSGDHGWHPEQNLGFDGQGTWWVEINWTVLEGALLTTHYWLVGWDALGAGDVRPYFYGTQNSATTVGLRPRVWAVDPTPGAVGLMGFIYSSGPPVSPCGTPATYGHVVFADAADGEWALGAAILLDTRYSCLPAPGAPLSGGAELRRQLLDHNSYQTWHDSSGARRARWGLAPREGLGESFVRFYDEASASAELSDAGYWGILAAAPAGEPGQLKAYYTADTQGALVTPVRRDPDGVLHTLTLPAEVVAPATIAGQDHTATDLLIVDADHRYWASEDSGETWYRCAYQLPWRRNFEGGRWAYIIEEAEYGGTGG